MSRVVLSRKVCVWFWLSFPNVKTFYFVLENVLMVQNVTNLPSWAHVNLTHELRHLNFTTLEMSTPQCRVIFWDSPMPFCVLEIRNCQISWRWEAFSEAAILNMLLMSFCNHKQKQTPSRELKLCLTPAEDAHTTVDSSDSDISKQQLPNLQYGIIVDQPIDRTPRQPEVLHTVL